MWKDGAQSVSNHSWAGDGPPSTQLPTSLESLILPHICCWVLVGLLPTETAIVSCLWFSGQSERIVCSRERGTEQSPASVDAEPKALSGQGLSG